MTSHRFGNLEMYADGGSIVVLSHRTGEKKRVSVPDWKERMEAIAVSSLNKIGSDHSIERDMYHDGVKAVQAMQSVLKEAEEQGDVTDKKVLNYLYQELTLNPKYTMKPKAMKK